MYALTLSDGTTTATFTGAPDTVLDYVPKAAAAGATEVAESFKTALVADTLAAALAEREVVGRLLAQAARVQGGSGEARVYVNARRDVSQPVWRSEVLAGSVQELDEIGYWPGRGAVRCAVNLVRRPYWEGSEYEVGLLSGLNYVTGGVDVCLSWGSAHVDLDPIVGEMAGPLRIMLMVKDTGFTIKRVYAALRSVAGVGGFFHMLEGENGGAGTPAASALTSGGYYTAIVIPNALAETQLGSWSLAGSQLAKAGGRWFRLVVRWLNTVSDNAALVQARLLAGTTLLWAGPWVATSSLGELLEVGSALLPPDSLPMTAHLALTLELWAKSSAGVTVNLDYIALLGLDAFRRYDDLAGGLVAQADYLFDDGASGEVYGNISGGLAVSGSWYAAGDVLLARPGYQHRLCFLWQGATGSARADKNCTVRAWYRARVGVP